MTFKDANRPRIERSIWHHIERKTKICR